MIFVKIAITASMFSLFGIFWIKYHEFTYGGEEPSVPIMAIQVFCALGGLIVAFVSGVLSVWI